MAEASLRNEFPRREMPRHMASVQSTFTTEGKTFVGTVVNISITGAMIMGCQPIAPNSLIHVNFPDVGAMNAIVIWNNGEALGISFEVPGTTQETVEKALSKIVNGMPEQEDRRLHSQYAQPATH